MQTAVVLAVPFVSHWPDTESRFMPVQVSRETQILLPLALAVVARTVEHGSILLEAKTELRRTRLRKQ